MPDPAGVVFLVGGLLLAAALLPTVAAGGGVPVATCALTGGVLTAYAVTFAVGRQWASAAGVGLNAALWGVLLIQGVTA